jgi:hypothetical protein
METTGGVMAKKAVPVGVFGEDDNESSDVQYSMGQVAKDKQRDREVRRYRQIAKLERQLTEKNLEIDASKAHTKTLNQEAEGLLLQLRAAARDEGELPLLDMMEDAGGGVQ